MVTIFNKNKKNYDYSDDFDYYEDDYYEENNFNNNYDNSYEYYNKQEYYYEQTDLYLSKRILSKFIDFTILFFIHYFVVTFFNYYLIQSIETKKILIWLFSLLFINATILFLIIPLCLRGQTIGKKIVKIKTIKVEGFLIGFKEAFIDYIFIFLFLIDFIYFIKNKKFLHNEISKTIVKPLE